MASAGKNTTGLVSRLRHAFRERWVVGSELDPYMPTTPNSTAKNAVQSQPVYRYPAPADQPTAKIPETYPETVYDTHMWKRQNLTYKAPENADQAEFDKYASPRQEAMMRDDSPPHVPRPWWWGDADAHAYRRKLYVESGLVAVGVFRIDEDYVVVGSGATKSYNKHLTPAGRRLARRQQEDHEIAQ